MPCFLLAYYYLFTRPRPVVGLVGRRVPDRRPGSFGKDTFRSYSDPGAGITRLFPELELTLTTRARA